jgi:hypothetical protein
MVERTLRAAGVHVYRDHPHSCDAPQIVANLTNTLFSGPHENIDKHEAIYETEGDVFCEVDKEPAPAAKEDPSRLRSYPAALGEGTTYEIGNVVCTIRSPESARKAREERLAAALRSLSSR